MDMLNSVLLVGLFVISFRLLAPNCQMCDTPAPLLRVPRNTIQFWGGWTCAECGYELDKWGEPVEKQPFPAKWSAKLADPPAPADDRMKRPRNDIERKGDYRE